jgi:hypothetical protein
VLDIVDHDSHYRDIELAERKADTRAGFGLSRRSKEAVLARTGRPKGSGENDEPILLEMALASLSGEYPSDWALAGAFADRISANTPESGRRRLWTKFRDRRDYWIEAARAHKGR